MLQPCAGWSNKADFEDNFIFEVKACPLDKNPLTPINVLTSSGDDSSNASSCSLFTLTC